MIPVIIAIFLVGALIGLYLLTHVLQNKPTPKAFVYIHGIVVAIALILLIVAVSNNTSKTLITALILFIITALGGFTMFYLDVIAKKPIPKALAIVHPVLAVISVILLVIFAIGY